MATQTVTHTNVQQTKVRPASSLLRRALKADGIALLVYGAVLSAASGPIATLIGLPAMVVLAAGLAFLADGVILFGLIARLGSLKRLGQIIFLINLAGVIAIPAVLVAGVLPLTTAGVWLMADLALVCAGLGLAQWLGLRREATA